MVGSIWKLSCRKVTVTVGCPPGAYPVDPGEPPQSLQWALLPPGSVLGLPGKPGFPLGAPQHLPHIKLLTLDTCRHRVAVCRIRFCHLMCSGTYTCLR
jgi:hypothetical protein